MEKIYFTMKDSTGDVGGSNFEFIVGSTCTANAGSITTSLFGDETGSFKISTTTQNFLIASDYYRIYHDK